MQLIVAILAILGFSALSFISGHEEGYKQAMEQAQRRGHATLCPGITQIHWECPE